jgi:plasmid stabilization system protein ParE
MGRKEKATPKTYQVRVSTNALQNIDEITGYIAFINHQPMNAIKIGDDIFATIDRIERNPLAFKECSELTTKSKMYRTATLSSHF